MTQHYKINPQHWRSFDKKQQVCHIASEIYRASQAWLKKDEKNAKLAYERALELIDFAIDDSQWKDKNLLTQLQSAVAALYIKKTEPEIDRLICELLLKVERL